MMSTFQLFAHYPELLDEYRKVILKQRKARRLLERFRKLPKRVRERLMSEEEYRETMRHLSGPIVWIGPDGEEL
jgi:hypothetical protein